ncbi:MAG: class I SAM-dependent methyltransferase [Prosthecobacter sp.]|jgi:ubiquinone/menaquinone biosynthesis C-methylase UbiE|uniref:class I SAM-dependent methyltransferase n=1 Tax=Prosthecobacter sp. TaxID=1965333 RepID=UPI001A01D940|nr:class I SAM-dependent methyltransferase [Prosthecobacter sp.]MBE2284051.1 class I SAM-dependent methyltransferase [Prosthecobacter sp.]
MRIILFLLLAAALNLPAQEVPPPLTEYLGREIAQTMHWQGADWLMRRVREDEEAPTKMRKELNVKPGMTVCDMGCGNGFHTLPLAEMVGENGKVLAVDVQPEMIEMLKKRIAAKGLKNIVPINGLYHDPKLPPDSCDMILLVDVYHEFSHPVQMLASMRAALKPDGLLVLVEFRAEDESVPIKPAHKMSKAQIHKEMNANGFTLKREYDELPWQHLMFFGKGEAK